ncbi:MAG TPA: hypothetical protein VFZ97_19855 [Acidimicrobiales bacterium]
MIIAASSARRRWLGFRACVAAAGVAASALLIAGCGGLNFSHDSRLSIIAPGSLSTVSTPVDLRWSGGLRAGSTAKYAVFVDSVPVHPGQNLRSLAGKVCAHAPGCVDVAWLNRHFVFLTGSHDLELDALPILGTAKADRDLHTATIVLVNSAWARVGESAWSVTFVLARARSL